ncbi:helix-turn-helix domain-containing protein [Gehongia tenuis]|uniref:Helix-turn-helix domain-containing protein n=1 Tax=Gehongia tenuis TaxID=2763655 RepID=A0A926D565_9FIRM|nr:helix-turn-helix domain-containing protein [Gehongia tenuis]MBC8531938.1 helix-turn-helix domain-containing protein [Gehongia tenuis]
MGFSNRLRQLRVQNGCTLEEFSRIIGISAQSLSRYELGQRIPKVAVLAQIAKKLEVNPTWLMDGSNLVVEEEKATYSTLPDEDESNAALWGYGEKGVEVVELSLEEYEALKQVLQAMRNRNQE